MTEETLICKSCGNTFVGSYCNVCGEKVIKQRDRKLSAYIGDLIGALTFAESKFWKTIKAIFLAPGRLSANFISGRRVAYMKPISVFFLANLLYFIFPFFGTFNTSLNTQMNSGLHMFIAKNMVENKIAEESISFQEYESDYNTKTKELSKLLLILMAVLLSVFFWLTHTGTKRLIADHFIFSVEFMAFILFFPVLIQSFLLMVLQKLGINLGGEVTVSVIALIMCFYFLVSAERNFFNHTGLKQMIFAFIGLIGLSICVFFYRSLLFFITFWSL